MGVRTSAQCSSVQTGCENSRKDGVSAEKTEENKQNVTAQLRAAAPDSQSYWESQHFLIIQDEQRKEKKNCSRLRTHENDREEKSLTTHPSQDFKFWRYAKRMLYMGV